jgi:hypothetical protein
MQQLYQVHMWLQDHQPDSPGLLTVLSNPQLQQCKEAWEEALARVAVAEKASPAHQAMFAAAGRLAGLQKPPQLEARTRDGLVSIDVLLTTAAGVEVAVEVHSAWHYRQPDLQPTGPSLWRSRVLAARGYVVVTVPYWEWDPLNNAGDVQKQVEYLQLKVEQAVAGQAKGL